ncbi:GTP 3',8-cyclase MoaA [Thermomonas sp.]|uniref:GTP 3',8-cyclase MoaA n=1 Tax=Thermomonas sp. TaxID=1971895 RepID=UPI0035B2E6B1
MATLIDGFGRTFPYLRLSLTEACNYRCSYCLPNGYQADGRPTFLVLEEIQRLVRGFAAVGMRKIRLTGGEPSLRKDLPSIIAAVSATPGVQKIALTTNGCLLPRHVRLWREAGLTALNVSLDSLQSARFAAITGHDRFDEVMEGVEIAQGLGFDAVKLNAVLLRGLNDDELPAWMDFLRDRDVSIRFIELMRTGDNQAYFERHHYRAEALEQQLVDAGWALRPRAADAGPAREYAHPGYRGRIGIIAPYSKDFCAGCNRLRVTARGDLRLCLFGDFGIPLRPLLQADEDHDALVARIATQLGLKAAGHGLHQGNTGITPHLASIGG